MKKSINYLLLGLMFAIHAGCTNNSDTKTQEMHFATSAEYPPFEYQEMGELKGFDIELAKLIAKQLGKIAVFDNMQFSSILPALSSGKVDAAISTITITDERKKNFDFSDSYYYEGIAAVFKKTEPFENTSQLVHQKLSAQLGSTMEIWLKKNMPDAQTIILDNNNQAIEALKAGRVDVVLMDGAQGAIFSQKNPSLSYAIIAKSEDGYGIAVKKGSKLTTEINQALSTLKHNGEIAKLKKTWLEGIQWKK